MTKAIVIDRPSDGARRLADALDLYRVTPRRFGATRHRLGINWGVGVDYLVNPRQRVLNPPERVRACVDKTRALSLVGDLGPPFWTRREEIQRGKRDIILCRRNGLSEGRGITVVRPGEELVEADFYTKYIRKRAEYRVHVVNGAAILIQQKRKRNGAEMDKDAQLIRSHRNGWVFCVNNLDLSEELRAKLEHVALESTRRIGLDFGAIDIIVERGDNEHCYFLEANTRPGIEGDACLNAYAGAFRAYT